MANVCIPKQVIEKLRTAIKSGAIDLEKLYDLGDAGRHELFSKYVGEDNASLANSKFEEGMLVADKAAKSDYIRLADKEGFAKTGAAAEFGKNLLTNEQKTKLAVEKVNERIAKNQERIDFHEKSLNAAHPDDKPTIQYKIDKLKDIADRLNIKKDNLENPSNDRMLKKINSISRLLSPEEDKEMMSDLVKSKMGQELTPAEGQYIVNKTSELNELAKANKDSTLGVSGEYLNKKAALDSYIRSLNPEPDATSIMKDIVEIVKNNYITNISTPLKTAISSALNAPTSMLIRRFSNGLQGLPVNGEHFDEALKLWKEDEKIDKQAGSSLSTCYGINDVGSVLGSHNFIKDKSFKGVLDEFTKNENFDEVSDNNKVSGVVSGARKALDYAAQKSHQLAIDIEHNWLFKKVYKTVFYDTLNLHSSLMAKTEGLAGEEATARSLEIMRDAAKIEPTTEAGKALRIDAQHAAAQVLNVDNTIASKFSVGVKNALNEAAPNIHIGTLLEPFAKIPANVIWKGIKNIPAIGIPDGISDIGFGAFVVANCVFR